MCYSGDSRRHPNTKKTTEEEARYFHNKKLQSN